MKTLRLALVVTLLQLAALVPLLYYHDALAGLIVRSTKSGSTTSFATSNSLGNTLHVADLDSDFNALYTLVNGSLDASNLAADSVAASELADDSVASANIIDGTIVNADINASAAIAGTKLAVGATVNSSGAGTVTTGLSFSTTETTLVTLSGITTRGGRVLITGTGMFGVITGVSFTSGTATLRLKRNGTTVATWQKGYAFDTTAYVMAHSANVIFPLAAPIWSETPAAGTYTYTLTGESSGTDLFITTPSSNAGTYFALELS